MCKYNGYIGVVFTLIYRIWSLVLQQLHEQHTLFYLWLTQSVFFLLCCFSKAKRAWTESLCHVQFYISFFPGHLESTMVPCRQLPKLHFENTIVPYQLPLRLVSQARAFPFHTFPIAFSMHHVERAGAVEQLACETTLRFTLGIWMWDCREIHMYFQIFHNTTVNEYEYIHVHTDALMWGSPQLCCNFLQTTQYEN